MNTCYWQRQTKYYKFLVVDASIRYLTNINDCFYGFHEV